MTTTTTTRRGLPRACYGNLSPAARETIRQVPGARIVGYVRHWFPDAVWHGDSCGCTDDRCIGYHHDAGDDCGCLPVLLAEYAPAATETRRSVTAPSRTASV